MRFMLLIAGSVVGFALGDWIVKQFEKRMNGIKSTKESEVKT